MRLKPDRLSPNKPPAVLVLNDRLAIVKHLRESIQASWPNDNPLDPNMMAAAVLAFADRLERDIREAG